MLNNVDYFGAVDLVHGRVKNPFGTIKEVAESRLQHLGSFLYKLIMKAAKKINLMREHRVAFTHSCPITMGRYM